VNLEIEQSVLETLPTMTKEVESLLDTLKQDFVEPKVLEGKLVACPVISGRVLQIANSSFYGLSREISSLREATIILGQQTLRSLVYSLAAMDEFKDSRHRNSENSLDYKLIWQHSLFAACLARTLAETKKLNTSDIFTAALFQHFGILILDNIEGEKISRAMDMSLQKSQFFKAAILNSLNLNYVNLSARVLNYWHFPVSVCKLIHSVEDELSASAHSEESRILIFANFIASIFLKSPLSHGHAPLNKETFEIVGSKDDFIRILEQTDILYSQLASNFIG